MFLFTLSKQKSVPTGLHDFNLGLNKLQEKPASFVISGATWWINCFMQTSFKIQFLILIVHSRVFVGFKH